MPAVALIPLLSGCGGGCSDVAVSDTLQVALDGRTVGNDHLLRVRLCQDGTCSEVEVPASQYAIKLSVAELRPVPNLDEPGEITAEVTNAAGRVIGATAEDFAFEDVDDSCGSARRQEISVEAGTAWGTSSGDPSGRHRRYARASRR